MGRDQSLRWMGKVIKEEKSQRAVWNKIPRAGVYLGNKDHCIYPESWSEWDQSAAGGEKEYNTIDNRNSSIVNSSTCQVLYELSYLVFI